MADLLNHGKKKNKDVSVKVNMLQDNKQVLVIAQIVKKRLQTLM